MIIITIPKKISKGEELIAIPKKEYERLSRLDGKKEEEITEENILRWSKEALKLKRAGKLPLLKSLKEFR